jgi:L-lysine 6-transaminase
MGIARSTKFGINVDFEKSHGSYLYDRKTDRELLDFFGMYASLPLGYNHPIFKTKSFIDEYLRVSSFKINNCEFVSDETLQFDKMFREFAGQGRYEHFHYSCTGALAVEAAIKACLAYKKYHKLNVVSFRNSFHGINSYGGFVTSRFPGADARLSGMPDAYSIKLRPDIKEVYRMLRMRDVTCVLVEPIQCSAGDIYFDKEFFKQIRQACDEYDVPLVFDEIQVGFGGTGKLWYYEHLGIEPDIIIFGKKTQLSGIMAKEEYGSIFSAKESIRLEVTWDGDVADMVRCKHIMKAYKAYDILGNVKKQSDALIAGLSDIGGILNLRNCGLIVGFDLSNTEKRDILVNKLYKNGLICNKTGQKSVRFRPNLNINSEEISHALRIIKETMK